MTRRTDEIGDFSGRCVDLLVDQYKQRREVAKGQLAAIERDFRLTHGGTIYVHQSSNADRNAAIRDAAKRGLKLKAIAGRHGLTVQRVGQIVRG